MIRLIVLDFDDTLCLTEKVTFHIENEVVRRMGYPSMSREIHLTTWGKPLLEAISLRVPGIDVSLFKKVYQEVLPEFIAKGEFDIIAKENLATLDALLALDKRLAVLTSRRLHEVAHLLDKSHPINTRIEKFYHMDNSDFIKPDPRVFDKVLSDFNVAKEDTVYVGDSVTDGIAAKGAGLHFIAVLESGLRTKEDFKDIPVDAFADSFPEILSYITEAA